jgi:serine phosphatase RsbU (regulator of sigma subunit)
LQKIKNTQNNYIFAFIALLAIILSCVAILLYRQNKLKNSINKRLQIQNKIIANKNEEIRSSIEYAKGIQQALLTSDEYITINLGKDYFIFYEPKDIVSGDFYWAVAKNNLFYIAIADCTGHGVPGAFMSLLNINFLNEIVIEKGIKQPAFILNEQRKEIIKALNPTGAENSKDGMDAVLMSFNFEKNTLKCACANNPVWIIRNNQLIELKPDKIPVSKHDRDTTSFNQHEFDFITNDCIYAFTDGYIDQFGGEKGKKFMSKQLKELLLSIVHLPMREQKQVLTTTFNTWKGNLEQIDDVCIMGIRI